MRRRLSQFEQAEPHLPPLAMLPEIEGPRIFGDRVSRCSVSLDLTRYTPSMAARLHVPLPPEVADASPKRQAEFVAGRHCALTAMRRLGCGGALEVGMGADRAPRWPPGVVGSITHTAGFVSAAVACARDVRAIGVDSELIPGRDRARAVGRIVLRDEERRQGGRAMGEEAFVALVFSAKESLFKCLFPLVGVFFEFDAAAVVEVAPATRRFTYRLTADLSPEFRAGHVGQGRFEIDRGYVHTAVEIAPLPPGQAPPPPPRSCTQRGG